MTDEQTQLVTESFESVKHIADTAAHLFYGRLFQQNPHLEHLFRGDMAAQGRKLMATLAVAVAAARDLEGLRHPLTALANRHVGYGAKPEHFDAVGDALLWTLAMGLGHRFTPEVKEAWSALYAELVDLMRPAMLKTIAGQDEESMC